MTDFEFGFWFDIWLWAAILFFPAWVLAAMVLPGIGRRRGTPPLDSEV
jgi:hypothetical protein